MPFTPTLMFLLSTGLLFSTTCVSQQEDPGDAQNPFSRDALELREVADGSDYSPYTGTAIPQRLLWGDTHLHSSQSIDANSAGNKTLSPAEAYRFARGDQLIANSGNPVRLSRPLDFLVVSDHAEYLGMLPRLRVGDASLQKSPLGREFLSELGKGPEAFGKLIAKLGLAFTNSDNRYFIPELGFDSWKMNSATADEYNQPGTFTSLIGYEWTYFPDGDNLHRVVVYRDGADKAAAMPPFSSLDGKTPEELWNFMADYEQKTGGEIMAIPHNSNVSNGRMFALRDSAGKALTGGYNRLRQRWEPIVEVTQIKGDSEAHPYLSPEDEFANFENWDKGNLNIARSSPKKPGMLQYEYARSALKLGLAQQDSTGANPFKFGMIGSTDAHTSLATGAENNFWGKVSLVEPGFARIAGQFIPSTPGEPEAIMAWQQVASGYAAVWATENTRAAIFDALKRKEVYATTGSRIALRFFGGWSFTETDLDVPDRYRNAYRVGVPMGGDLAGSSPGKSPSFLIAAAKDPIGANLDRIQVVKGWQDQQGVLREKVYNVAVSPERQINDNGETSPVKSTVDPETATYKNSVGAAQLEVVWRDPDFNAGEHAFYYVRVLEIPTPRWTEYDRRKYGFEVPAESPREIQDRAYSSPIWYTP
ncbi:MAG: DUF3604 domain-containing protein [Halieaceae bacterium]|nr:DUF3604 domain-containing protein [Halieaceae bacterium]